MYRQEKLLKLLAWYFRRITDYPSLTVLRARGPSHRCTLHEELNECGTESEQKDAELTRTKDVWVSVFGNSSSMVIICLLSQCTTM